MRSARAVSARAGTAAATSSTDREQLSRFSAGLYCGGAIDHHCPLPGGRRGVSGECFWLREKGNSWSPVATHDMQSSHLRNDLDRWDPSAFGQEGFRRFNKREAAQCLRPRRVLVVGDSTAREVYAALTAQAGSPIVRRMRWMDGDWEPRHHWTSVRSWEGNRSKWYDDFTLDRDGPCTFRSRCVRDLTLATEEPGRPAGRAGFVFVTRNSTEELTRFQQMLASQPWQVVLVQCPFWHFFAPQAYNYSIKRSARQSFVRVPLQAPAGPIGFGKACAQYVSRARRQLPNADIYVLGLYQMGALGGQAIMPNGEPAKVHARSTAAFEAALQRELHDAMEIRCEQRDAGYAIAPTLHGVTLLDRYNLVGMSGARTRDGSHLVTGATHAVVQHMMNWMCVGKGEGP